MTKQLASSEGDLTKRLHVLAHDELGATSQNVNRFIENLQLVLSDIITSVKKNIELAHRISKESSSITDSAKEQISDATHLVNSLESVYHDVGSANTIMLEIQEQSAYNLEAFSKMHLIVTDIIDQFKKTGEFEHEVSTSVGELSTQAQDIKNVVNLIKEIAD